MIIQSRDIEVFITEKDQRFELDCGILSDRNLILDISHSEFK